MDYQEIKDRMHSERLYYCSNEELTQEQLECLDMLYDFNNARPVEAEKKASLLKVMFAEIGENCYIEPPLHSNWGGKHMHFGDNVYANFNFTVVDDTDIYVGNNVLIGPNVTLVAGTHPIHPGLRAEQAQYNVSVVIGNNVWLGAGAVVLPGVHIGDNSVIGAGSVVTKDIPANVVAVGNPCRVLREINEDDMRFYNKGEVIETDLK